MSEEIIIPPFSELTGIELFLPSFTMAGGEILGRETRCFPGVKYGLGYRTIPDNFTLTNGDSLRSDLVISLDIISGNELVESVEINSYSNPFIKPSGILFLSSVSIV